jgi:hypothetical protein
VTVIRPLAVLEGRFNLIVKIKLSSSQVLAFAPIQTGVGRSLS